MASNLAETLVPIWQRAALNSIAGQLIYTLSSHFIHISLYHAVCSPLSNFVFRKGIINNYEQWRALILCNPQLNMI